MSTCTSKIDEFKTMILYSLGFIRVRRLKFAQKLLQEKIFSIFKKCWKPQYDQLYKEKKLHRIFLKL